MSSFATRWTSSAKRSLRDRRRMCNRGSAIRTDALGPGRQNVGHPLLGPRSSSKTKQLSNGYFLMKLVKIGMASACLALVLTGCGGGGSGSVANVGGGGGNDGASGGGGDGGGGSGPLT